MGNATLLGPDETVEHIDHNMTDSATTAMTLRQQLCTDCDIPSNVLFYDQHNGLSSANEQDFKLYYEKVDIFRNHYVRPIIDEFKERADLVFNYEIKSPAATNEKEQAEIDRTDRELVSMSIANVTALLNANLISREEAGRMLQEQGVKDTADVPEAVAAPAAPPSSNNDDEDEEEPNNDEGGTANG